MDCPESFSPPYFDVFLPIVSGDTYPEGIQFDEDGIDWDLSRVTIDFKLDPAQETESLKLDSDTGGVTLLTTSASGWAFLIPSFEVTLPAGDYIYHVRAFFGDDHKRTLLSGVFQVQASI